MPSSSTMELPAVVGLTDLQKYAWLGFDLDHAVARYRVQHVMRLVFACLTRGLEELKGWPREVFLTAPEGFETVHQNLTHSLGIDMVVGDAKDGTEAGHGLGWIPSFVQKGLVFDFDTGDLLKLDSDGMIRGGYHGLRRLSSADLRSTYGEVQADGRTAWTRWKFDLLRIQSRHESFFVLITYFDIPCQLSLCQGVHWLDAKGVESTGAGTIPVGHGTHEPPKESISLAHCANPHEPPGRDATRPPPKYGKLWADHNASFNNMFDNVAGMETGRGGFFPALRSDPRRYLCPRGALAAWLRAQRIAGKRTVLVTNSHVRYARFTAEATLGADWRSCFDVILYNGLKPAWFTKILPWRCIDEDSLVTHAVTAADAPYPLGEGHGMHTVVLPLGPQHLGLKGDNALLAPPVEAFQGSGVSLQLLADGDSALRSWYDAQGRDSAAMPQSVALDMDESGHVVGCRSLFPTDGALPVLLPSKDAAKAVAVAGHAHPHGGTPHPVLAHAHQGEAVITAMMNDGLDELLDADTGAPIDDAATSTTPAGSSSAGRGNGARTEAGSSPLAIDTPTSSVATAAAIRAPSTRPAILYVGDHIHGDVVAAVKGQGWDAVAVVEELELSTNHGGTAHGEERNWDESYSRTTPWGSFFHAPMADAVSSAAGSPQEQSYFGALLAQTAVGMMPDVAQFARPALAPL